MRAAIGAVLAGAGITLAGAGWLAHGLWTPADPTGPPQVFVVEEGEPLVSVAGRLDAAGLLAPVAGFGPRILVLYARIRGMDRKVRSGEYDLAASMAPTEILDRIVEGAVKTHAVTLPDGLTIEEVAARIDAAGIAGGPELILAARDPDFARLLEIEGSSLEGYLFPETYRFRRDTPPREILRRMVEEFRASWTRADRSDLDASGFTLHEVVTLASIVEKETGTAAERPRIAAVFLNRLDRGMRLQSDPTVIYGILRERGEFDGNIRRSDLRHDTPYNTYRRGGLPPGPIASPSLASIRGVLAPEAVPYLYFVSQNDGTHHFSTTLRDHINAVNRYQR